MTVRILKPNNTSTAGPVEFLHNGAFLCGQTFQLCETFSAEPHCDEFRLAQVCDVRNRFSASGSTDQARLGPNGRRQAERHGEPLHLVEIRRREADIGDVFDPDRAHARPLFDHLVN